MRKALFWGFLVLAASAATSLAQVQVDISIKRRLFIKYEPVLATVTVTNLTGNELTLADVGLEKWFDIQLETLSGRPVPPIDAAYSNPPVELGPGQKITRTVNLSPIFPISEFGGYRVRAAVFVSQTKRYFTSPSLIFEITEGQLILQKTVGVPDGGTGVGGTRDISLLSHRLTQGTELYIRIEDRAGGIVYCTHKLGRLLSVGPPQILFDQKNKVHILQTTAPKTYIYSHIGLNGEVLERKTYNEFSSRPLMRRGSDGSVLVLGGQLFDPAATSQEKGLPALHDRPVPLPTPEKKEKSEDPRPKNLLSN